MKAIIDFLTTHPLIPIRSLEKAAGCPDQTIQQVITDQKKAIPDKWAWPIIRILCGYGFTHNGWAFTYNDETDCFFVSKPIDRDSISHEVFNEAQTASHFEYQVWYYRDVISDDLELIQFLNSKNKQDEKEEN